MDRAVGDVLLAKAAELSDTTERLALLRQGLTALIERESARRRPTLITAPAAGRTVIE